MTMISDVLAKVAKIDDVMVAVDGDEVVITVMDFDGFDDDWHEQMADYDEEAVDDLLDWLEGECLDYQPDFYTVYVFDGFEVVVEYASDEV